MNKAHSRAMFSAVILTAFAFLVTPGLVSTSQISASEKKVRVCDKDKRHHHWHSRSDLSDWKLRDIWSRVSGPRSSERAKFIHIRRCAKFPKKVDKRWKRFKKKYSWVRSEKRAVKRLLVYQGPKRRWAIPYSIVHCESYPDFWNAYNPSGAEGPYQLLDKPNPWPVDSQADKRKHHLIAGNLWNGGSGRGHWQQCL